MDPAPPVYAALDALGIRYERHEHPAVFNAADASQFWDPIPGVQCKNLFLRNKKGDRHYLVVVEISKRVDLKDLVKLVGDDMAFPALLDWLATAQAAHGLRVESAKIESLREAGRVRAELSLVR